MSLVHYRPNDDTFSLNSDIEILGIGEWTGTGQIIHPAAPECARMIWEWVDEYVGDAEGCLTLLTAACELGYPGATETLTQELTCLIDRHPDLFQDFGFDQTVSNALYHLAETQHLLPLDTLQQCVKISNSNTAMRAISMIASIANEEALTILIQLHGMKVKWPMRDHIAENIEELAGRLGIRIVWDGDRLVHEK